MSEVPGGQEGFGGGHWSVLHLHPHPDSNVFSCRFPWDFFFNQNTLHPLLTWIIILIYVKIFHLSAYRQNIFLFHINIWNMVYKSSPVYYNILLFHSIITDTQKACTGIPLVQAL